MENKQEIESIYFPNTVADEDKDCYRVGVNGVDKIERITKNGKMASIGRMQVITGDVVMAEIKESVCDIYYVYK